VLGFGLTYLGERDFGDGSLRTILGVVDLGVTTAFFADTGVICLTFLGVIGFGDLSLGLLALGVADLGVIPDFFAKTDTLPGVAGLGVAALGVAGLGVAALGVDGLGVTALGVAGLGVAALGVAGLGVAALGVAGLGVAGFGVAALGVAGLGVAALGVDGFGEANFATIFLEDDFGVGGLALGVRTLDGVLVGTGLLKTLGDFLSTSGVAAMFCTFRGLRFGVADILDGDFGPLGEALLNGDPGGNSSLNDLSMIVKTSW
jgi:PPE-repeat protein